MVEIKTKSSQVIHSIFRSISQLGEYSLFLKGFGKNLPQPEQLYQTPAT